MENAKDVQITGTMSDYLVERLGDEEHGQEYAVEYFKADFLTAAAISLFTLRREAGLTQAQIAERLHTKQSAIARLEADFDGAMSLRRYIDFVLACGSVPHHLTFTPIETARAFTIAQPETPLTFENQQYWSNPTFQLTLEPHSAPPQTASCVSVSATTLREAEPRLNVHDAPAVFDIGRAITVQKEKTKQDIAEIQARTFSSQERVAA